jgi:hypothetical protein
VTGKRFATRGLCFMHLQLASADTLQNSNEPARADEPTVSGYQRCTSATDGDTYLFQRFAAAPAQPFRQTPACRQEIY